MLVERQVWEALLTHPAVRWKAVHGWDEDCGHPHLREVPLVFPPLLHIRAVSILLGSEQDEDFGIVMAVWEQMEVRHPLLVVR